ncbi:hypothetical protein [Streptomyces longispororuber]|uniref:hypothetical protein n=1 Tax=Streptomyces longispororuber TaxID=68230 RepID=UPI0037035EB3
MTNPADELRAAAATLRTLATAAADDSGNATWKADRHFPEQPDAGYTALWATGARPLMRGGGGRGRPPAYVTAPVGDYIAAMGPTVGLALATWLDAVASSTHGVSSAFLDEALAVARAINGSQP